MKTERSRAASGYANAISELAEAAGGQTQALVLRDLKLATNEINSSPDLQIALHHPAVPPNEKKDMIVKLFKERTNDLTLRLLELLCDRRRIDLLPQIEQEYQKILCDKQNILAGTLVSAEKMNPADVENIKNKLNSKYGKSIELQEVVDKSLLGGFVLRLGDEVIDGSLKGRLHSIKKSLLSV